MRKNLSREEMLAMCADPETPAEVLEGLLYRLTVSKDPDLEVIKMLITHGTTEHDFVGFPKEYWPVHQARKMLSRILEVWNSRGFHGYGRLDRSQEIEMIVNFYAASESHSECCNTKAIHYFLCHCFPPYHIVDASGRLLEESASGIESLSRALVMTGHWALITEWGLVRTIPLLFKRARGSIGLHQAPNLDGFWWAWETVPVSLIHYPGHKAPRFSLDLAEAEVAEMRKTAAFLMQECGRRLYENPRSPPLALLIQTLLGLLALFSSQL